MSLQFQRTIAERTSRIILSCHMIEGHRVLQSPYEQAAFLLKQLNRSSLRHYPLKPRNLPKTTAEAHQAIVKNDVLRTRGEKAVYFAYDRHTGECVGMITAAKQRDNTVILTQMVERTDYEAQYEMLRLAEKSLFEHSGVDKVIARVVEDYSDNMRLCHLSWLGYKCEDRINNTLFYPNSVDYLVYAKSNPIPAQSRAAMVRRRVSTDKRTMPRDNAHTNERTA